MQYSAPVSVSSAHWRFRLSSRTVDEIRRRFIIQNPLILNHSVREVLAFLAVHPDVSRRDYLRFESAFSNSLQDGKVPDSWKVFRTATKVENPDSQSGMELAWKADHIDHNR